MTGTKCTCPNCNLLLKPPKVLPARIECPQCRTKFTFPPEPAAVPLVVAASNGSAPPPLPRMAAAPPPAPLPLVAVATQLPPVEPAEVEPASDPRRMVIIGGAIAGAALLLLLGIGLAVFCLTYGSGDKKADEVVEEKKDNGRGGGGGHAQPVSNLPPEQQAKANQAIDRGVDFLKKSTNANPYFGNGTGEAALIGLTLLECGVPANDPAVEKLTDMVRKDMVQSNHTYTLSLAILFLEKLGAAKDRDLIRSMGLRLISGQGVGGGWTYNCPLLSAEEEKRLLAILADLPPVGQVAPSGSEPNPKGKIKPQPQDLPANLWNLALLKTEPGQRVQADFHDNSNTQFAILACWAARRNGVPMDHTLALVDARFRASQYGDGSWTYTCTPYVNADSGGYPSMTCAGLIGLAVGRGIGNKLDRGLGDDPALKRGLQYMGKQIGRPSWEGGAPTRGGAAPAALPWVDHYLLWSIERVAVAYDLRYIAGKDWYGWGAEMLIKTQHQDGSWHHSYPGNVDTCFALLFLKRANVAKDLTSKIRQLGNLDDLGGKP